MADADRTFGTDTPSASRARNQGLGVGQREMDVQRDPDRHQTATNPQQRSFDRSLDGATNGDRPSEADFGDTDIARDDAALDPDNGRDEAGFDTVGGDLGAGTPANVDIHKLGQSDRPEQDWGEASGGAVFSSNHSRRPDKTEAERGQGAKTRQATKDQISRRG